MGGEVHGRVERVTEGWRESGKVGKGLEGWRGQEVLREARVFTGDQGSCRASEKVGEVQ